MTGRSVVVRGLYVGNGRFGPWAKAAAPGSPCVRFGTAQWPDYAQPSRGERFKGGHLLTPGEAEQLARGLLASAAWARAQGLVDSHEDMP